MASSSADAEVVSDDVMDVLVRRLPGGGVEEAEREARDDGGDRPRHRGQALVEPLEGDRDVGRDHDQAEDGHRQG